jgi:hypothetical protein
MVMIYGNENFFNQPKAIRRIKSPRIFAKAIKRKRVLSCILSGEFGKII